jgi:hypothetical protein
MTDWSWKPDEYTKRVIRRGEKKFHPPVKRESFSNAQITTLIGQLDEKPDPRSEHMARALPASGIPEDFGYAKYPDLRKWIEAEFPTVDPDKTMERFVEYAQDVGRMATIWTACFKRVIRTGIEKKYDGIVVYRAGRQADPKWSGIISLAKQYGFRDSFDYETHTAYTREFETWKDQQKRAPVIEFGPALRQFK